MKARMTGWIRILLFAIWRRMIRCSRRGPLVFLSGSLTEDEPGFVSLVAMVETVWVLGSCATACLAAAIASAIERMLQADTLDDPERTGSIHGDDGSEDRNWNFF